MYVHTHTLYTLHTQYTYVCTYVCTYLDSWKDLSLEFEDATWQSTAERVGQLWLGALHKEAACAGSKGREGRRAHGMGAAHSALTVALLMKLG